MPTPLGLDLDLDAPALRALLRLALSEDIGSGDLTSACTIDLGTGAVANIVARQDLSVAGLALFAPLLAEFQALCADPRHEADAVLLLESVEDGSVVKAGTVLCRFEGSARGLLTLERTFLNFVGHLSGIATETARFVEAVRAAGATTRILDTRKTTPGLRQLEKYAVACGGGSNHRMGLYDAVLIKDNHVVAAGGITNAVKRALSQAPAGVDVEVECDTVEQLREALDAGATSVLLDNFTPDAVEAAVAEIAGRARIEVSGGITLGTVADYARAGADDVSVGFLTHSAVCVDVSMEVELVR
jgi:nicotinate-nucleotide pyrophosphorylase (carboxylating)